MIPLASASPVRPIPFRKLVVRYVFAGKERWADIAACLRALVAELNSSPVFGFFADLIIEDIDILRGGDSHDLLDEGKRKRCLSSLVAVHVLLITPPCDTFTRAVFSGFPGPKPIRDFHHPRGFLDLTPGQREKTEAANVLYDFSVEMLREAAALNVVAFLESPEDLGKCRLGKPASIW